MRVLIWSERFWPCVGGAEVFAVELVRALRPRGYEFAVFTDDEGGLPPRADYEGTPIRRFPFGRVLERRDLEAVGAVRARVAVLKRTHAPDLVLAFSSGPSVFFELSTRHAPPAPLVARLNSEIRPRADSILGRICRLATRIVCVSREMAQDLATAHPDLADRVRPIYGGSVMSAAPAVPDAVKGHVVCLGRLIPDKGFDDALRAFAAVAPRFPEARLTIAGDGIEEPALRALAASLGIAERTAFPGWVPPPAVADCLASASIVLLPSRTEGLPNVGIQAACVGRAMIGSRVGGVPEIIEDGRTGFLVPPGDHRALAGALKRLLGDPELSSKMGEAARVRASQLFDWDRCVERYDALLREAVAQGAV